MAPDQEDGLESTISIFYKPGLAHISGRLSYHSSYFLTHYFGSEGFHTLVGKYYLNKNGIKRASEHFDGVGLSNALAIPLPFLHRRSQI